MKVYRYGLRPPIEGQDLVSAQMRAAHGYHNKLIEIERSRREAMRTIEQDGTTELHRCVVQLRTELDGALAVLKHERRRTRKRSDSEAQRAKVTHCRNALQDATRLWRETVKERRPVQQDARDRANEHARAQVRAARAECGVYWGTYQLAEEATMASAKMPLWDRDAPNDPRFLRWTGEGAVSAQIIGGVGVQSMQQGESTQVAITAMDVTMSSSRNSMRQPADPNSRRSRLRKRLQLWLRVGSDEQRGPVWAKWPMVLHRPLPLDGAIKRVTVSLRLIGPRPEWDVQFTVDEPARRPTCGHGAVAIDLGWRQRTDGKIRVGFLCDDQMAGGEIVLPDRVWSGLAKPDELQRVRDENFNTARDELARWLCDRDVSKSADLFAGAGTLGQWRSQARLAALAIRWRTSRFDGDADAFDAVEAWRKQDKHLWLWETSQRTGAHRARREFYRLLGARLATKYDTLVIEDFDMRRVAKRQPAEAATAENETAQGNRQKVAPSELRLCLVNAFLARGGKVVKVDAAYTTRTCSVCSVVESFDQAAMLRHECANGHAWDQDANAAANMIERWRGTQGTEADRTPDEPRESRRDRVRRMRADKVRRMDHSRIASDDSIASGVA